MPPKAKPASTKDEVKITLAHPIDRVEDKRYLGLDEEGTYNPGDEVTVNKNGARSLIASGYAAVDPEDAVAVAESLGETPPNVEPGSADTPAS